MISSKLLNDVVTGVEGGSWDDDSSEVDVMIRSFERDIQKRIRFFFKKKPYYSTPESLTRLSTPEV